VRFIIEFKKGEVSQRTLNHTLPYEYQSELPLVLTRVVLNVRSLSNMSSSHILFLIHQLSMCYYSDFRA